MRTAPLLGRGEDELVGGEHIADSRAGGGVRPHDADSRPDAPRVRLVPEEPLPAGEPMDAKLALARFIVRSLARGRGRPGCRGAFHQGRPRGRLARRHPRGGPRDGDPLHLPALLATAFGLSMSEARRMIGQGGVKLNGNPVDESTSPRLALQRSPRAGREAPRFGALRRGTAELLVIESTAAPDPATTAAAREGGSRNALVTHTGARPRTNRRRPRTESSVGLWRESGEVFRRPTPPDRSF